MVESPIIRTLETELAIRRIQWFTIIWMAVEVAVAFVAAIRAHSVALAAFGGDSAIELMSAAVVLARFRSPRWITEQFASKITGWLLVALAAYITVQSLYTLIAAPSKPEPSYVGIVGLAGANANSRQRPRVPHCRRTPRRAPCALIYLGSHSLGCS